MEQLAIERSIWIAASPERVWQALTDPAQLTQWYAPGCAWEILALKVGATIKFYNSDTDIQRATIEAVEPLLQLTLRWQLDPATPALTLVNTFRLAAEAAGTRVIATQAGYELLPEPLRQTQWEQDAGAYTAIVESLKEYVERANG